MKDLQVTVELTNDGKTGYFDTSGAIFCSEQADKLMLSVNDFYTKDGGLLPDFPHHEVIVYHPTPSNFDANRYKDLLPLAFSKRINRWFIDNKHTISTEREALMLFEIWSMGTAYMMVTGKKIDLDFDPSHSESARTALVKLGIRIIRREISVK